MSNVMLHYPRNDAQYGKAKEGSMSKRLFQLFTQDLVREYGKKYISRGYIDLCLSDLPVQIQREYFKQWYLLEGEDYECFTIDEILADDLLLKSLIADHQALLDRYLEDACTEALHDYMDDHGLTFMQHRDNGELSVVRR